MTLTRKLSLALTLGILVVLVTTAVLRVRREVALFERDSRCDSLLIGRMLAGSVQRAWPSIGEAQALDLVEDANQRESAVRIRWVWLDAPVEEPDVPRRSLLLPELRRERYAEFTTSRSATAARTRSPATWWISALPASD
jgi:hypothetical protein